MVSTVDESPFRLYAPEIRKPRSECQVAAEPPALPPAHCHLIAPVFQDFVTDWSPEESSRRLQQGQVSAGPPGPPGPPGPRPPSHLLAGCSSGEVPLSAGQNVAPGLGRQHPRRERHHSRKVIQDLTPAPSHDKVFPRQVLIHLRRTLSKGERGAGPAGPR